MYWDCFKLAPFTLAFNFILCNISECIIVKAVLFASVIGGGDHDNEEVIAGLEVRPRRSCL